MFSLAGAFFFVRHACVFVALAATSFILGRRLLGDRDYGGPGEELAIGTAMGLGAAGMILFGLGLIGCLTPAAVAAGAVLVHVTSLATWRHAVARRFGLAGTPFSWREASAWLPAGLTLVLVAVLSCYPPTAFDATAYHLPYARAFAASHRIVSLPARRFPVFPQLSETIFSAALLAGDETDVARVELLALIVCLAALSGSARRRSETAAGPWAASSWIGCPAVALLSASAYVDVGFAMFALLAFLAWERWRDEASRRWLAVSAVFAGFSAGVKYHGLAIAVLLGIMTMWVCRRRRLLEARSHAAKGAAELGIFALVSAGVASPWYVRNFIATGNPVFPFLPRLFGASPYSLSIDAVTPGGTGASDPTMSFFRGAREWFGAPWRAVHSLFGAPDLSGQTPLSPFLAPRAAIAVLAAFRNVALRRTLLFAAVVPLVACGGAEVRFLLPVAALISYAGAAALARGTPRVLPALRIAVAAALVLPGAVWTAHRIAGFGAIPIDPGERDAFLRRNLPPYAAIEYLNRTRGADYTVYAVGAENLAYFTEGNLLGDWFGPFSYAKVYGNPSRDPDALDRNLRRIGAPYLLVDQQRWPFAARDEAGIRRHFRVCLRGPGFVLYERSG